MANNAIVVFEPEGHRIRVATGVTVLDAAKQANVAIRSECNGQGTCGKCKIIIKKPDAASKVTKAEKKLLSRHEIKSGLRLACQTRILKSIIIAVPRESRPAPRRIQVTGFERHVKLDPLLKKFYIELHEPSLSDPKPDLERLFDTLEERMPDPHKLVIDVETLRNLPGILRKASWHVTVTVWATKKIVAVEPGDTRRKCYGFGVDVGTSKIVGNLIDLTTGETVGVGSVENPQIIHGEDVITRITYATKRKANLKALQKLAVKGINDVLRTACTRKEVSPRNVYEATVVGNTAIHHLLLGIEPKHLTLSPFAPAVKRQLNIPAKQLGIKINPAGIVTFLPIIAGFVGADAVADVIAAGIHETGELSMLIDIGTNTEIIIGNKHSMLSCSCASGPAFEGAHIKHGTEATAGAIEKLHIRRDDFKVEYETIDDAKPTGLCGSAMIDIVAELHRHNLIDKRGRFLRKIKTDRLKGSGKETEFLIASKNETSTGGEITISQGDINEILLAKAAISAGCSILLKEKNVAEVELERVFIAGAFGNYLSIENAEHIGMIPHVPTERTVFIGNAAITGAKLALRSKKVRERASAIVRKVRYLELANHPEFNKHFANALFLDRTTNGPAWC
jgi:uncharacterized 2Fe-2S/4Fe-4S cluster protein (DUF4445 family)